MEDSENKENNVIKIVDGTGKELDISKVDNHLPIEKPKIISHDKKIIVPKPKK